MANFITNSILDDEPLPFAAESATQGKLEDGLSTQYNQWKQQDTPQTRRGVLTAVQPVIDRTVASYGNHPYITGQAKKLALQALHTYDPQKGKLQSHIQSQLRGLQRLAMQQEQIISLPERVMLDRRDLLQAETTLEDKLGRLPSVDEIANYTGLNPRRIAYIRGTSPAVSSGSLRGESGEPIDPAVQSAQPTTDLSLWERMVYEDLSPRDKVIYDYTLGSHGTPKMAANALAARLGVTPAAISQRKAAIQQQLDQEYLMGMDQT